MNGLTTVNIELTNRCNKSCHMCGRRKAEKNFPELAQAYNKDMSFEVLQKLAQEIPPGIVIQFHNNGEPTVFPELKAALDLFPNNIKCFNTNAKLLVKKAGDIIGNLDSLTISVIQDDDESERQYEIVKEFLAIKGDRKPFMIYRLLGEVSKYHDKDGKYHYEENRTKRWHELPGLVCTRILHNPMGSFNYTRKVTIPEIGVCLDLLNHLAVDVDGNVSFCVRFDPNRHGVLGNILENTLEELWHSQKRTKIVMEHLKGNRNCNPLCSNCHFYGCPTGM